MPGVGIFVVELRHLETGGGEHEEPGAHQHAPTLTGLFMRIEKFRII